MTIQSIDTQLLLFINHALANEAFDMIMPALSQKGYLLMIPFLLAMFLKSANTKISEDKTFLVTAVATLFVASCAWYLSGWAEDELKAAIARERPCRTIVNIRLLIACPQSFSMPSGHAITSFAAALPFSYLTREYIALIWRLYPLFLASLIAFSRVYLGVHYPTDVLAGTILGSAIGLALSLVYQLARTGEIVKREK